MIEKISRYLIMFVSIIVLAVFLPKFYRIAFEKVTRPPFIEYSAVKNDFLILTKRDGEIARLDSKGNFYTKHEYELALPFRYYKRLASKGLLKDTICGIPNHLPEFRVDDYFLNLAPKDINKPPIGLYPLFESETNRFLLTVPDDFFHITPKGIEFITAGSNQINVEKSNIFTEAMKKQGFVFPAKHISGFISLKKKSEEGYFITDSTGQLYHLKMENGAPYCRNLLLPEEVNLRHIECVDLTNKEYYAILISIDNFIYILKTDTYELVKLPISDYNPDVHKLKLTANIAGKTISLIGEDHIKGYALDRGYNLLDSYHEHWIGYKDSKAGKIASIIFPFEIMLQIKSSSFVDFFFYWGNLKLAILLHLLLLGIMFYMGKKRKQTLLPLSVDLAVVLFTGIFGFIAVNIYPNRF